jgi:hypothetical protein
MLAECLDILVAGRTFPMESYKAKLHRWDGQQQSQEFSRLTDAILWLSGELDAGDGHSIYGEIHFQERMLWRRGTRPAEKTDDDTASPEL